MRSSVSWDEPDRGKTTISRLLFRLHDVTAGAVRLGGVDIRRRRTSTTCVAVSRWSPRTCSSSRARCATTSRCSTRPSATLVLRSVFASLDLDRWLDDLSNGFDTVLGATGRGLSAGEAQLVALARVPDGSGSSSWTRRRHDSTPAPSSCWNARSRSCWKDVPASSWRTDIDRGTPPTRSWSSTRAALSSSVIVARSPVIRELTISSQLLRAIR